MDFQAFNGNDPIVSAIRLLLAGVALIHSLLSARVVIMRMVRSSAEASIDRVPTGAMLAYGILTANIARLLLVRIPQAPPVNWTSIAVYACALAAGTWGFTHIVVLHRRERRRRHSKR